MHIISLRKEVAITSDNSLKAGVDYIAEDTNGGQLIGFANGGTMTPLTETKPFDETKDWNGKRILVVRVGGLGDLTLLTPVLREINRRWPTVQIDVACHKEFAQALENLPYCKTISYPVPKSDADSYDAWCFYENAIEGEDAKTIHSVDLYAKIIGLTGDFDKVQDYAVTEKERIWQEMAHPRKIGVRRIAIQVKASALCRSYPQPHLQRIVRHFVEKKWEVFMMGAPGEVAEVENEPENFINMTVKGLNFRHRCAVLATCDVLFSPDSSLTHVAGALGVPCIAAYGPFPWQVRTKYNPLTKGINGVGKCAPCFHHQHMRDFFPKGCPSASRGVCQVLEAIRPERVIALITKHARNASEEEVATEVPAEIPEAVTPANVEAMPGAAAEPVQQ